MVFLHLLMIHPTWFQLVILMSSLRRGNKTGLSNSNRIYLKI